MRVDWLEEEYKDVFKYVTSNEADYVEEIYQNGITTYSSSNNDVYLNKLETVMFSTEDVSVRSDRNWLIDSFGSKDSYMEFHQRRNKEVKFCVYQGDECVDVNHPAFRDVDIEVIDFTGRGFSSTDLHGTSVCSQYATSDVKYCPFPDIAENQMVVKAGTVLYGGIGDFKNITAFITWAAQDAKVMQERGYYTLMNLSLGADAPTPPELEAALKSAYEAGILIFSATGNSARNINSTPAVSEYCQGVMALMPDLTRAKFSNVGPNTVLAEGGVMNMVADRRSGGVGHQSGTSFASPFKINSALAILSLFPHLFKKATDIVGVLTTLTKDLGAKGRDDIFGHGKAILDLIITYNSDMVENITLPTLPKNTPKKRTTSLKSIKGWEISYKSEKETTYKTIFIEELDISYTGFYNAEEVEEKVLPQITEVLKNTLFTTNEQDYERVAKLVVAYLTKSIDNVKITYAIIDNNRDSDVVLELTPRTIGYWCGARSVLRGNSLTDKKGKVMLVGK